MHCLRSLGDRDGFENSSGETLCNGCFHELWREKADMPAQSLVETALAALRVKQRSLA
jgi:hypothetical protein